jgi:Cu+-exporting ATPase
VQRISVDLTKGYYDPSVIHAKAGVPLEISFGQGSGCLGSVLIPDFSVNQDLTNGGAVVKLPAMKAGEYSFSCGMRMVYGKIVVQ